MSAPVSHPIALERVFFTKCMVSAVADHVPSGLVAEVPGPVNTLDVKKDPNRTNGYIGVMKTVLNSDMDKATPYSIEMVCFGEFSVEPSLSDDEAHRGVTITAHSVLYGAIRECVSWMTGRQPYGPLILGLSVLQSQRASSAEPDSANT